jgi:hypothetical protein
MNDEFLIMCKEVGVTYFNVLSQNLPEGTQEKKVGPKSWSPDTSRTQE